MGNDESLMTEDPFEEILLAGWDDWVNLFEVAWVAKEIRQIDWPQVIDPTLQVIEQLAKSGMMVIGDLGGEGGRFSQWDSPVEKSLERIQKEWLECGGGNPAKYNVCWLASTPKGKRRAEEIFKRIGR